MKFICISHSARNWSRFNGDQIPQASNKPEQRMNERERLEKYCSDFRLNQFLKHIFIYFMMISVYNERNNCVRYIIQ